MIPTRQRATDDEIASASHEGLVGALHGASKWGAGFLALGLLGHVFSPVYRNLTLQFKVYLQLSGMTVGSMIEADRRFREAEKRARVWRKMQRDRAVWAAYEGDFQREASRQDGDEDGD